MIGLLRLRVIGENATLVLDERLSIHRGRHRPAHKNFRHDFINDIVIVVNQPKLGHSRIGENINLRASATHAGKGVAGTADVRHAGLSNHQAITLGSRTNVARGVDIRAEAVCGLFGARQVTHASVEGDEADLFDELIGRSMVPAVATACIVSSAVQYKLHAQIYFDAFTKASDLDPVG